MSRCFEIYIGITLKVFVNIQKGGRGFDWFHNAETKPMRLVGAVVRVLADDDGFDLGYRGEFECVENVLLFWVDLIRK